MQSTVVLLSHFMYYLIFWSFGSYLTICILYLDYALPFLSIYNFFAVLYSRHTIFFCFCFFFTSLFINSAFLHQFSLDVNVYYPSFSIIFLTNLFYMNLLISSLQITPTHHPYTISLLIFPFIFIAIITCYYHCCLLNTSIVYGFYPFGTYWYLRFIYLLYIYTFCLIQFLSFYIKYPEHQLVIHNCFSACLYRLL